MYVIQCPKFCNHPDEMCGDPWLPTEKGNFRVSDFRTVGLAKATLSQTKVFVSGILEAPLRMVRNIYSCPINQLIWLFRQALWRSGICARFWFPWSVVCALRVAKTGLRDREIHIREKEGRRDHFRFTGGRSCPDLALARGEKAANPCHPTCPTCPIGFHPR